MKISKKRVLALFTISLIISALLILRLFAVSVINHEYLKESSDRQNQITVSVSENRGNIYDRNMNAFTGVNPVYKCVIFATDDYENNLRVLRLIEKNSDIKANEKIKELVDNKAIVVSLKNNYDKELNKISNIKIALTHQRYLKDYPATNVIGYVQEDKGITGLEKLYDNYLSNSRDTTVSASVDATNKLILGYALNVSDFGNKSLNVVTTLDLKLSRICKQILEEENIKGAVALIDLKTFDILALVSSPDFDPTDVSKYLSSEDNNLLNRAVCDYDMGSIFKIVVAAAALENNAVSEQDLFYCSGKINVSGKEFLCHNVNGHGWVTLSTAFSESCNCAFIEIGQKAGYKNIVNMAKKFGIGEKIIRPYTFDQDKGTLPDINNYYLADEANVSIGQGRLSANVVQGALLSGVIANKGCLKSVNLVDHIANEKGDNVETVRVDTSKQIISEYTAEEIYKMMLLATADGTGKSASDFKGGCGGKTGTAQTGWYVNNENYQHAWFTGFFPKENPEYVMCVFVENGKSGSNKAAPIFAKIADAVLNDL